MHKYAAGMGSSERPTRLRRPAVRHRTKVIFIARLSSKPSFIGGIVKAVMNKMFTKIMIAMKYHIETGKTVSKDNIKGMKNYKSMEPTASLAVIGQG